MTRRSVAPTWFALDAVVTGANALAYLLAASTIFDLIGLSTDAGRTIGVVLLAFTAAVAIVAWRSGPRWLAWGVVGVNSTWVIASLVVAATSALDLNGPGRVWAVAQAAVVGALTVLQAHTLRQDDDAEPAEDAHPSVDSTALRLNES